MEKCVPMFLHRCSLNAFLTDTDTAFVGTLCARTLLQYLIPWARVGSAREDTQDPDIGRELWTWLEEQVNDV